MQDVECSFLVFRDGIEQVLHNVSQPHYRLVTAKRTAIVSAPEPQRYIKSKVRTQS